MSRERQPLITLSMLVARRPRWQKVLTSLIAARQPSATAQVDPASRLGRLPLNLSPQSVAVSDQGMRVSLSGGSWHSHHDASAASCTTHT